ncbi:hypothetical protein AgCh_006726 [Apium graveolens]
MYAYFNGKHVSSDKTTPRQHVNNRKHDRSKTTSPSKARKETFVPKPKQKFVKAVYKVKCLVIEKVENIKVKNVVLPNKGQFYKALNRWNRQCGFLTVDRQDILTGDRALLSNVVEKAGPVVTFGDKSKGLTEGYGCLQAGNVIIKLVLGEDTDPKAICQWSVSTSPGLNPLDASADSGSDIDSSDEFNKDGDLRTPIAPPVTSLRMAKVIFLADFINIDCGIPADSNYTESYTGLKYVSDFGFIDAGESKTIPPAYRSSFLQQQLETLRSFPEGTRNCYTLKPVQGRGNSVAPEKPASKYEIVLQKTNTSTLPPILNALELYTVEKFREPQTDDQDVGSIMDIKSVYRVRKVNWQGDPCAPQAYAWDGIGCSYNDSDSLRITSLDLSNNNLSGEIPGFLSQLTFLRNLTDASLGGGGTNQCLPSSSEKSSTIQIAASVVSGAGRSGAFVAAVNINSELFYPGGDIVRIPNAAGRGNILFKSSQDFEQGLVTQL